MSIVAVRATEFAQYPDVPHEGTRRSRFRRAAQYVSFAVDSLRVVIAMQPVHQDVVLSPRKLVLVSVSQESDTLASFILQQERK